ncbi:hypothetical protein AN958_06655, partial [Leucoagaricus sp. SymC.cos]
AHELFKVKPTCVGLLGSATLTLSTIPTCLRHLDDLIVILRSHSSELPQLPPSLVSYIFFPISSILQRNTPSTIPDQIFEKVFVVLGLLSESWWWHCEIAIWEQIFMLCGSVLGGMASKGKGKDRDDEVKEAAAQCLYTLLHERNADSLSAFKVQQAKDRLSQFQTYARTPHFLPILGQTLSVTITISESCSPSFQRISLKVLQVLIELYASDEVFPMILPGLISSMSKVTLGSKLEKQWANGEIVAAALRVMQVAIVKTVGDDVCIADGALQSVDNLEGLAELVAPSVAEPNENSNPQYKTERTPSWLKGTTSQLHIAINGISALTKHPSPIALRSLATFSRRVLEATPQTLPQTQPLLLVFLLSMLNSSFDSTLMRLTSEYLSSLPRLISIQEESKIQHLTGLIEAVCKLAFTNVGSTTGSSLAISKGIGKLLGPSGGVEKWGWSLLGVFEFSEAPLTVVQTSAEQLMLESDPDSPQIAVFPCFQLKNLGNATLEMIERMYRALGAAAGESCLYSIEWFIGIGKGRVGKNAVAAVWCACRLLEGLSGINLSSEDSLSTRDLKKTTKRLEKLARSLARTVPELWDRETDEPDQSLPSAEAVQDLTDASFVERKSGLHPLHENLKIIRSSLTTLNEIHDQPVNHRALCLQIISVCIGILQSRSSPLFIHVLYPVLHSLVSQVPFLASTAFASLQFMTIVTSHASPANLLLSNFDYALDAISRRLTRRWLDVDATQVLVLLVRLVGNDVVEKAGDVVEESYTPYPRMSDLSSLFEWYRKRKDPQPEPEEDFGPAPRRAWGEQKEDLDEKKIEEEEREAMAKAEDPSDELPPTPTQALAEQIVSRSLYFLTHASPVIRARILTLLASSVPNLPSSALMPAIHSAWPFILNRLGDQETFVVSAAASLIEALSTYTGEFMFRRIWDDIWPKFKILLSKLQAGEETSALVRGQGSIGTESAYTHSHRLYRAVINTMAAALEDVRPHERSFWDVLVLFRRFLSRAAHPELQQCAKRLYNAAMTQNGDVVWLVLTATYTHDHPTVAFLFNKKWDIVDNAQLILGITSAR